MELGETLKNTIIREVKEEIGIEIKDLTLFKIYLGPDLSYRYPNGDEVYVVSAVYLTHDSVNNIILYPAEHPDYQYFDIHALTSKNSPPIIPVLTDLQEKMKKKN